MEMIHAFKEVDAVEFNFNICDKELEEINKFIKLMQIYYTNAISHMCNRVFYYVMQYNTV